jgi:hypothetical protein
MLPAFNLFPDMLHFALLGPCPRRAQPRFYFRPGALGALRVRICGDRATLGSALEIGGPSSVVIITTILIIIIIIIILVSFFFRWD